MFVLKNLIQPGVRTFIDNNCHLSKRSIFLQAPLFNHNKFEVGLNPWDKRVELEGTNKSMHWPSYNERYLFILLKF